MPSSEKEYNGNLFDQLTILDDLEEIAKEEKAVKRLVEFPKKRKQIERKLYQQPPLISE